MIYTLDPVFIHTKVVILILWWRTFQLVYTPRSISINDNKVSTTISEKMDYLVPAAKIADMATGWLAGQAARDFTATDERMLNHFDIEQSEEFKTTKYFLQLLGFAVISELPWYLHNGVDGTHNVLFTLALGVMALAAFETLKKDGILCGAVILSIAGFATWLGVDYEWRGILIMVVFIRCICSV